MALLGVRSLSRSLRDVEDDGKASAPQLIALDRVGAQREGGCLRVKLQGDTVDVESLRVEPRRARLS
jgi:hypothetical protein